MQRILEIKKKDWEKDKIWKKIKIWKIKFYQGTVDIKSLTDKTAILNFLPPYPTRSYHGKVFHLFAIISKNERASIVLLLISKQT